TGFWLMGITTLIGSAVAIRGRLVSTAVLSLVGGALAPALLGNPDAPLVSFLAYLLMLQLVALALAWWGARPKWWVLRGLALSSGSVAWALARSGPKLFALSVAYQAQAVALLALTIPVAFSGVRIEMGWAALAVALAVIHRRLHLRAALSAAPVMWALALMHL